MLFLTSTPAINHIIRKKFGIHSTQKQERFINKDRISNELIFRIDGMDKIHFDGNEVTAGAGSVEIMPPHYDKPIKIRTVESGTHIDIFFHTSKPIADTVAVIDTNDNPSIKILFAKIRSVWVNKKDGYYLKAMSLLYQILYELEQTGKKRHENSERYERIEPGIQFIRQNFFKRDFSHRKPAEICGISYTYFHRLFQQKFGTTSAKYVTRLRMEMAVDLLLDGQYTMDEIARMTGYENGYYFSRVFKETYGCPPSRY